MKACIFHGPGDVRVEERPMPEPGPGELLLRMEAAGLCHSDIRVYRGEKYARPGVVPGHENVGAVLRTGEGDDTLAEGQRVALCPVIACGHCPFCLQGLRNRCPQRVTLGYEEDGGLAQYLLVPRRIVSLGHVLPVPEGLSAEVATLTEPLACVLNSLEACRFAPASSLLVLAGGPMGLLHVLAARAMGAATVIVAELDEQRLDWARRFGADLAVNPQNQELEPLVLDATGGLAADAVVVSTGVPGLLPTALACVRRRGAVNLFAGFPPGTLVELDPNDLHYREVTLTGSQNASTEQYRRALALLPVLSNVAEINTHRFGIEDGPKAYESRLAMDGLKSLVVF